jgi:hypothetical protein
MVFDVKLATAASTSSVLVTEPAGDLPIPGRSG